MAVNPYMYMCIILVECMLEFSISDAIFAGFMLFQCVCVYACRGLVVDLHLWLLDLITPYMYMYTYMYVHVHSFHCAYMLEGGPVT